MPKKDMEAGVTTHEGVSSVLGEGVGSCKWQVIGVVSPPGAWTNVIGKELEGRGVQVLWPGQTPLVSDPKYVYEHNCENPEVGRIHDIILKECDKTRYSSILPSFFSFPFPGPKQFLSKFLPDKPVVVVDPFICLVWEMWRPYMTDVVVVNAEESITRHFLKSYIDGNMSDDECRATFEIYLSQLQKVEDSFVSKRNHLYSVSNECMQDGRGGELADSILKAMDGSHVR